MRVSLVSVPSVARGHGGTQSRVDRIVLHGTVGPCKPGHSVNIARYLNSRTSGGKPRPLSVHEIVDPTTCTIMLPDDTIAYGDGHNTGEWQIEFCDPQAGDPARWSDPAHNAMLTIAAARVRAACRRLGVPMVRITAPLTGKRGICGHGDVFHTWGGSGHTDPDAGGPFPWARFIAMVNDVTPTAEDDDMSPEDIQALAKANAAAYFNTKLNPGSTPEQAVTVGQIIVRQHVAAMRFYAASTPPTPEEPSA